MCLLDVSHQHFLREELLFARGRPDVDDDCASLVLLALEAVSADSHCHRVSVRVRGGRSVLSPCLL